MSAHNQFSNLVTVPTQNPWIFVVMPGKQKRPQMRVSSPLNTPEVRKQMEQKIEDLERLKQLEQKIQELEKQKARVEPSSTTLNDVLASMESMWEGKAKKPQKTVNPPPNTPEVLRQTERELLEQLERRIEKLDQRIEKLDRNIAEYKKQDGASEKPDTVPEAMLMSILTKGVVSVQKFVTKTEPKIHPESKQLVLSFLTKDRLRSVLSQHPRETMLDVKRVKTLLAADVFEEITKRHPDKAPKCQRLVKGLTGCFLQKYYKALNNCTF